MDAHINELLERLRAYGADTEGAMDRMMDDAEFYERCLRILVEDSCFDKLEKALRDADYSRAFDEAHNLKGVSANLGVTPLYQAVCEIVEPLRSKAYDGLDGKLDAVIQQRERLKKLLDF